MSIDLKKQQKWLRYHTDGRRIMKEKNVKLLANHRMTFRRKCPSTRSEEEDGDSSLGTISEDADKSL